MRAVRSTLLALAAAALTVTGCGKGLPHVTAPAEAAGALAGSALPFKPVAIPDHPLRAPEPVTVGNRGTLCVGSPETVPALKALINGAHHSIYFETFNFLNDSMGKQIAPLLAARAKEGLEVKVVVDFCGSRVRPGFSELKKTLTDGGVDLQVYDLRTILKDDKRRGVNITHRKVYLADGDHALIGGVNLRAAFDTTTQDVLVDWHGPVVATAYREFALDWAAAGGGKLMQVPVAAGQQGPVQAQVVVTSPTEGRYECRDTIIAAVNNARQEILIENQYLWDTALMDALTRALSRGVKVRIIVPGEEDKGVFKYIHSDTLQKLTKLGAEARLYNADGGTAHLHVKYFGIDGHWVAIGSANGDTRGFQDNQELDTAIDDRALAADFQARLFEHDWALDTKPWVYKPGLPDTKPFQTLLEILAYYM